jgi:uncharacterized protein (TIGR02679 family)
VTFRSATQRLDRLELTPLIDELARRYGDGAMPTTVMLRNLDDEQRSAVADLLGMARLPPVTVRLRVDGLRAALGLNEAIQLRTIVEQIRGPLPDRRGDRVAADAQRADLWSWLAAEANLLPLAAGTATLEPWIDYLRRSGVRGGVDAHRKRLERAIAVLRKLPADGVPLAALADDVIGDPHALDNGRTLSAIVLSALAVAHQSDPPEDAESARLLWETVGVAPDPLSSAVLTLGLRADHDHPLAGFLERSADDAEPVVLTLAQLRRWPIPPMPLAASVFTVENPSLIADAANRGWSGPSLVCSSGRPTVAVVTLLRQLGVAGCRLYQHADFDCAGLAITGWLEARAGTVPWRMATADYSAAITTHRSRVELKTPVPATPWDPQLHQAMLAAGVVVFEEELRTTLLDEMALDV